MEFCEKDIWGYRQNHPELIVRDLKQYVQPEVIRQVLKFRGVNKWLCVRKLLIQLKSRWKDQIDELEIKKTELKQVDYEEYLKLKGYCEALKDCRQQIRALCHSPRNVDFPENPREFGKQCVLPSNFPIRPNKQYLWRKVGE